MAAGGLGRTRGGVPGDVYLGFPGVGGVLTAGNAGYVRIRQQPTALQETPDPRLAALESDLTGRGFAVQRVADMDGWLAYHAASRACITAALYLCRTDPVRLAADRATLRLMCRAITEAFAALRASGTAGLPRNHAVLHSPLLRAVAVRYWARTMRSPMGEQCFAAHARHAEARCGPGPRCPGPDYRLTRPDGATHVSPKHRPAPIRAPQAANRIQGVSVTQSAM